jgi:hypothetical protein
LVLVALALSAIALHQDGTALPTSAIALGAASANASGDAEMTFVAHATDGSAGSFATQITNISVATTCPADASLNAAAGDGFLAFSAATTTPSNFAGVHSVPDSAIVLVVPGGARAPAIGDNQTGNLLFGTYCFEVPTTTTTGTLEVSPGTQQNIFEYSADGSGTFTSLTFEPSNTAIDVPPPPPTTTTPTTGPTTTTPTTTAPTSTRTSVATTTPKTKSSKRHVQSGSKIKHTSGAFLSPGVIGGGGAGAGLLVLLFVIPIWRRRRFEKAAEEGRVIIDSPPLLLTTPIPANSYEADVADVVSNAIASGEFKASSTALVDVLVLGPVEIRGLARPIKRNPVRELLVFLALNPGRSFTSGELQQAVWVEGRSQPKGATFRNYLTELRKSVGSNVLARDGYRYTLKEVVFSDWSRFNVAANGEGERVERLGFALDLIRGMPFEGSLVGRNSPYAWASRQAYEMEAAVERAAHELTELALETGELIVADAGVSKALLCVPESLVLREDDLRIGAAIGGSKEFARRLEAARAALGTEAQGLELVARRLGYEGP